LLLQFEEQRLEFVLSRLRELVGGGRALSQCGGQKWAGYLPGWWPMLVKGKYGIGIPRR
jgi:hypothetical protein